MSLGNTSGSFWAVTLGTRMLFLQAVDRCAKAAAEAECAHWRAIFGNAVLLEVLDGGGEIIVARIACAIASISKDGTGVSPAQVTALGFSEDLVCRHWAAAMDIVADSLKPQSVCVSDVAQNRVECAVHPWPPQKGQSVYIGPPLPRAGNVIPFRRRP